MNVGPDSMLKIVQSPCNPRIRIALYTHSLHCSSFLGVTFKDPYIIQISLNHEKELQWRL